MVQVLFPVVIGAFMDDLVEGGIDGAISGALESDLSGLSALAGRCDGRDADYCRRELGDLIVARVPLEDRPSANFSCSIGNPNGDGMLCAFIPNVYRTHQRSDGLEVILSEAATGDPIEGDRADLFYGILNFGGLCDRPDFPDLPLAETCFSASLLFDFATSPVCGDNDVLAR